MIPPKRSFLDIAKAQKPQPTTPPSSANAAGGDPFHTSSKQVQVQSSRGVTASKPSAFVVKTSSQPKPYPIGNRFINGYKSGQHLNDGETRQTWVKRVWIMGGECNFWKGAHNIYIGLPASLPTEAAFSAIAGDIVSTESRSSGERLSTHKAVLLINLEDLRGALSAHGYNIDHSHVILHDHPRLGKYAEVTIEFSNTNSGTSRSDGSKFRETQVLNIHFRHDGDGMYNYGFEVTSPDELKALLCAQVEQYVGKLVNGEVKENMNLITICSYRGRDFDVIRDTNM